MLDYRLLIDYLLNICKEMSVESQLLFLSLFSTFTFFSDILSPKKVEKNNSFYS